MRRTKSKSFCHLVLEIFDLLRKELDHPTANSADHMIVMFMVIMMLVICLVVAESHFAGQSSFGQEL